MGFRITGERRAGSGDGRGPDIHSEFRNGASEALAVADRLRKAGYDVQITDRDTGKPCDEAGLKRSAGLEHR